MVLINEAIKGIMIKNNYYGIKIMSKKIMLSGIQPTGELHIGNYLGAIKNWVELFEKYYGYFIVVDYHAITIEYDTALMQKRILDAACEYLACGLTPDKCAIFVQSHVKAHTELAWIFNSVIPVAELERMTQFKDKSKNHESNINAGLLTYPALMAADILLYQPDAVPVGEDQAQHLELTRMIARKFNARYGEYFDEPDTIHSTVTRILGLDGQRKMSKSLQNHISLRMSDEETEKAILRKGITDVNRKLKTDKGNPDICNMYSWHSIFSNEEVQKECREGCQTAGIGCVDCKRKLVGSINAELAPIRERIKTFDNDKDYVYDVLNDGAKQASTIADKTLEGVKEKMGLISTWRKS